MLHPNGLWCSARIISFSGKVSAMLRHRNMVAVPVHQQNRVGESSKARWILQTRDLSYKHRLKMLNLLPLSCDREMKDLTYFFKLLNGFYDLNISNFVSFVSHNRTRNCKNPSLVLKVPSCKTSSFQSSLFNRIVPLWNYVCRIACPADL